MPSNLLVVDIETVPDRAHHEGDAFAKPPFHRVVAIGFLAATIRAVDGQETHTLQEVRCGGEPGFTEKQLLDGFFHFADRLRPRLVTFNGRSFDLPVLKYRAMLHEISAAWLHGTARYDSYLYRFDTNWHCDLMDVLSDFGASKTVKLEELSALFGLPGKMGVDGSQVEELHKAGKVEQIRNYCETDVINTYLIYLRHMLHRGELSREAYDTAVSDLENYLRAEAASKAHFSDFLQRWHSAQ